MSVVLFAALFAATAVLAARSAHRGHVVRIAALCAAFPLTSGMVISSWVDVYTVAGFPRWLVLRERHRGLDVPPLAPALATKPTSAPRLLPIPVSSPTARPQLGAPLAWFGPLR